MGYREHQRWKDRAGLIVSLIMVAVLLFPYLVWVAFAGFLNYAIWSLNA